VILVTGDAYVDHPSYGAPVIGRVLEAAGFRVGIIAQPDWRSTTDFARLGRPRLFFGITAGNLDSMVANYTANKRPRERMSILLAANQGFVLTGPQSFMQQSPRGVQNAYIVIGGIEASLRRFAHLTGGITGQTFYPARFKADLLSSGWASSRWWRSRVGLMQAGVRWAYRAQPRSQGDGGAGRVR